LQGKSGLTALSSLLKKFLEIPCLLLSVTTMITDVRDNYSSTNVRYECVTGLRGSLKPTALPSVFSLRPTDSKPRHIRWPHMTVSTAKKLMLSEDDPLVIASTESEMVIETDIEHVAAVNKQESDINCSTEAATAIGVQCALLTSKNSRLSINDYQHRPDVIKYYTDLTTMDILWLSFRY